MGVKNQILEIQSEYQEVMNFLNSVSNPKIEEHINEIPISKQAKEFLVKLTKTVIWLANKER